MCLGEHPLQRRPTPHPKERPRKNESPARQRRRERRKAARHLQDPLLVYY